MKPNERFLKQSKDFWAHVRQISEHLRYSDRITKLVSVPTADTMRQAMSERNLDADHIADSHGTLTEFGQLLLDYFQHRADVLNNNVQHNLMNLDEASQLFDELRKKLSPKCPLPLNKQKNEKSGYAYLTGIVNMLIEANSKGFPVNYDPQKLTTITRGKKPLRTLARRVDGAFTSTINPIALWEIKEYYNTTTFGSRIADGVYESLLDGMELEELREHENIDVKHYLFVDAYGTWWSSGGRAYLCRIVDMLHMYYVDEVLFGKEVVNELPRIVKEWVTEANEKKIHHVDNTSGKQPTESEEKLP